MLKLCVKPSDKSNMKNTKQKIKKIIKVRRITMKQLDALEAQGYIVILA